MRTASRRPCPSLTTRKSGSSPLHLRRFDPRLDPALTRAATIAQERAHARSKSKCWRYVKQALLASGAISSYPKTALAKQAGDELVRDHGFEKLPIDDPHAAPVGAVIVYYKGAKLPGHVEIRDEGWFRERLQDEEPVAASGDRDLRQVFDLKRGAAGLRRAATIARARAARSGPGPARSARSVSD